MPVNVELLVEAAIDYVSGDAQSVINLHGPRPPFRVRVFQTLPFDIASVRAEDARRTRHFVRYSRLEVIDAM